MKKSIFILMIMGLCLGCSSEDNDNPTDPDNPDQNVAPVAVDDSFVTVKDEPIVLETLIENDQVGDFARIASIDTATEKNGTVVDNRNDTFTYTPANGFVGTDTFTYRLCDNQIPANCTVGTVTVEVVASLNPVGVQDEFSMEEDSVLTIDSLLENDVDVLDNATITSVDFSSSTGIVELNVETGILTYRPQEAFVGTDTFTYTVCNGAASEGFCDTATVTITITDQGSPEAVDDQINVPKDKTYIFSELLDNDVIIDDATITAVDGANNGVVELTNDSQVSYTPMIGFVGTDTFTYTLCDDDQPTATCVTATVTVTVVDEINFTIPAELQSYYQDMSFFDNEDLLLDAISSFTEDKQTRVLSYGERHNYLYEADEDPANSDNVILLYSGESRYWEEYTSDSNSHQPQTFNTEHVYPRSILDDLTEANSDLHHLRACDADVNTQRSNQSFVDGSGTYADLADGWYPGDEWKGDVARMIMYVNIRYGDSFDDIGDLQLFLKWNQEDPVSQIEKNRNNIIQGAQGNRNPFIDNPYLATLIWGGTPAENTWE